MIWCSSARDCVSISPPASRTPEMNMRKFDKSIRILAGTRRSSKNYNYLKSREAERRCLSCRHGGFEKFKEVVTWSVSSHDPTAGERWRWCEQPGKRHNLGTMVAAQCPMIALWWSHEPQFIWELVSQARDEATWPVCLCGFLCVESQLGQSHLLSARFYVGKRLDWTRRALNLCQNAIHEPIQTQHSGKHAGASMLR